MATIQGQSGPQVISDGVNTTVRTGRSGELNTSDAHGRYQEAVYRGNAYSLSVAAAAPTGFVGAAGGTPLLAIYNPANSGKHLVLLQAFCGIAVTAGTAGTGVLQLWAGPSVLPTGTLVTPVNQLSLTATGSVAKGVSNAAMTSSTAITNNYPLETYYWATAAGNFLAPGQFDIAGAIVVAPGNLCAFGLSVVPTSTTVSAALIWEEILV